LCPGTFFAKFSPSQKSTFFEQEITIVTERKRMVPEIDILKKNPGGLFVGCSTLLFFILLTPMHCSALAFSANGWLHVPSFSTLFYRTNCYTWQLIQ
jgi:hypothetical protein